MPFMMEAGAASTWSISPWKRWLEACRPPGRIFQKVKGLLDLIEVQLRRALHEASSHYP